MHNIDREICYYNEWKTCEIKFMGDGVEYSLYSIVYLYIPYRIQRAVHSVHKIFI